MVHREAGESAGAEGGSMHDKGSGNVFGGELDSDKMETKYDIEARTR